MGLDYSKHTNNTTSTQTVHYSVSDILSYDKSICCVDLILTSFEFGKAYCGCAFSKCLSLALGKAYRGCAFSKCLGLAFGKALSSITCASLLSCSVPHCTKLALLSSHAATRPFGHHFFSNKWWAGVYYLCFLYFS